MRIVVGLFLVVVLALAFPSVAADETETAEQTECILVIGDSIAYGSLVIEIRGHGFAVIRTEPASAVLQRVLNERAEGGWEVRDYSAAASSLSDKGKYPYRETDNYRHLMAERCGYAVMFPWINDLTLGKSESDAEAYVEDVMRLVDELQQESPAIEIMLLSHYYTRPAPFTASYYGNGVKRRNVDRFHSALMSRCESLTLTEGESGVTCIDLVEVWGNQRRLYLLNTLNAASLNAVVYGGLDAANTRMLAAFWRDNPQGRVVADGVHLSAMGKNLVAEAISVQITSASGELSAECCEHQTNCGSHNTASEEKGDPHFHFE